MCAYKCASFCIYALNDETPWTKYKLNIIKILKNIFIDCYKKYSVVF